MYISVSTAAKSAATHTHRPTHNQTYTDSRWYHNNNERRTHPMGGQGLEGKVPQRSWGLTCFYLITKLFVCVRVRWSGHRCETCSLPLATIRLRLPALPEPSYCSIRTPIHLNGHFFFLLIHIWTETRMMFSLCPHSLTQNARVCVLFGGTDKGRTPFKFWFPIQRIKLLN